MKKTPFPAALLLATALVPLAGVGGCQSDKHMMIDPGPGSRVVCRQCYDEIYKEQHPSGSRWGGTVTQTHTRHVCPDCKTEMSIYSANGVLMVKCAKCAPEGLACDKCLPPKDWTPPSSATPPAPRP